MDNPQEDLPNIARILVQVCRTDVRGRASTALVLGCLPALAAMHMDQVDTIPLIDDGKMENASRMLGYSPCLCITCRV